MYTAFKAILDYYFPCWSKCFKSTGWNAVVLLKRSFEMELLRLIATSFAYKEARTKSQTSVHAQAQTDTSSVLRSTTLCLQSSTGTRDEHSNQLASEHS